MDPRRSSRRSGAPARASPRSRGWTVGLPQSHGDQRGFPALAGMDPTSSMQPPPRARLPRARGDGPGRPPPGRSAPGASPRSRGWTRKTLDLMPDLEGFPALAGMDRGRGRGRIHRRRLPRARGDGPCHRRGEVGEREASPRSRGWTLAEAEPARLSTGFPALAGMDLFQQPLQRQAGRLPRARGDGPLPKRNRRGSRRASPRSRGWTSSSSPCSARPVGFPALAGMDPPRCAAARRCGRLPRARGDGPVSPVRSARTSAASPRSRGWTRGPMRHGVTAAGFPALAGMDPGRCGRGRPAVGLPRARGDGPALLGCAAALPAASPRSRGWTRRRSPAGRSRDGFPALAGMDPWQVDTAASRWRLPRARGDGPSLGQVHDRVRRASPRSRGWTSPARDASKSASGFPALAGMDPSSGGSSGPATRLPRARGDGPLTGPGESAGERASPRSRGWTIAGSTVACDMRGFPALAGMDLDNVDGLGGLGGLPRARGDGPSASSRAGDRRAASPRSRGWTRPGGLAAGPDDGFPALAGMDPAEKPVLAMVLRLPRARGDGP